MLWLDTKLNVAMFVGLLGWARSKGVDYRWQQMFVMPMSFSTVVAELDVCCCY